MTSDEHLAHHDEQICHLIAPNVTVICRYEPDMERQVKALLLVLSRSMPDHGEPPAHEDDEETPRPAVRRKPARRAKRELARLLREAHRAAQEESYD